jgi:RNA polymerase sigma-70 factor, ECF subfamily
MRRKRERNSGTHFEQVPLEVVKRIAEVDGAKHEEAGTDVVVEWSLENSEPNHVLTRSRDAAKSTQQSPHESDRKTLGDILYADKTKIRPSEADWVKLVRSIAAGDQLALHTLYERTYRIVFTLIIRITANRETAEEVTIDVFHDVWRKASTYDTANGPVIGWIMDQARCRAIDRLRHDQRKKRGNTYPDNLSPSTDMADPQQSALFEEQSRHLRAALAVLTTEERQVIEATFFSELSYPEVAGKLSQPLGTVKTRIRSGLNKLRTVLAGKLKG